MVPFGFNPGRTAIKKKEKKTKQKTKANKGRAELLVLFVWVLLDWSSPNHFYVSFQLM